MSHWDFGMPPAEHHDFRPWTETGGEASHPATGSTAPYPVPPADDYDEFGDDVVYSPISYERDPYGDESYERDPLQPAARRLGLEWPDESWPPRRSRRSWRGGASWRGGSWRGGASWRGGSWRGGGRPRWVVPAAVAVAAVAVGASVVLIAGGHPAGRAGATGTIAPPQLVSPAPQTAAPGTGAPGTGVPVPLTMTEAQGVLAGYTSANNGANARRSDALLATIETGTSYAIDSGLYRVQRAEHAPPYPAFGPARARYYIPRQQAADYPHWFVVQVANASFARPGKVTGTEYLLFTQAAPGTPWKNAIEPYLVPGATAPRIALDSDGLATAIAPGTTSLAVTPARLPGLTAASLDGAGPLPDPGNLADRLDLGFWRAKLPAASVSGRHAPAPGGQVFGLRTADGGALLFYTDAAELTLTPPPGSLLHLKIPGFYSPGQALSRAEVGYLEQFATYVPARGGSGLKVIADYSGITSRN